MRMRNSMSDWIIVHVRLRQVCLMSPWLLNVCMDGVVMKVNAGMLGKDLRVVND